MKGHQVNEFERMASDPASRRTFLKTMTAAGLGVAAMSLLSKPGGGMVKSAMGAAVDKTGSTFFPGIPGRNINEIIVNFALTLEILEADLYRQALNLASGLALTTPLSSNSSSYSLAVGGGGLNTYFTAAAYAYLVEFAYVEAAHRDFLKTLLSSLGAPQVTANTKGYKFASPVAANLKAILTAILPLEETGVRAYLGALPYFTDLTTYATTAGTIYSTEARHSAAISYTLGIDPGPNPESGDLKVTPSYPSTNTFEYYNAPTTILTKVKPLFVS
jgi:hypothetical protein